MLEDPAVVLRDMTLENPIRAIREISHDTTCKKRVRLANGREASALEIQSEYFNRAKRYQETKGLSPLEDQALGMWEHCLTGLERDPWSLDRECDWVIKHRLIDRYQERNNAPENAFPGQDRYNHKQSSLHYCPVCIRKRCGSSPNR